MLKSDIQETLDEIRYKDYTFWVVNNNELMFVYGTFYADGDIQTTRLWLIQPDSTKSQVVQTVFKCILTSEEHEAREAFRYNGAKIFAPHFDVDQLAEFAKKKVNLDIAEPAAR